jgi:hypothetical protein
MKSMTAGPPNRGAVISGILDAGAAAFVGHVTDSAHIRTWDIPESIKIKLIIMLL